MSACVHSTVEFHYARFNLSRGFNGDRSAYFANFTTAFRAIGGPKLRRTLFWLKKLGEDRGGTTVEQAVLPLR